MNNLDKLNSVLLNGNPMLFLGAGFSYGSKNSFGDIPTGKGLAKDLFNEFVDGIVSKEDEKEILQYNLQELCQYINRSLKKEQELKDYLIKRFKNVVPQEFHYILASYPWKKIYTVNIDDLVENIYRKLKIDLVVQNANKEKNVLDEVEYIKLHGCVNKPEEPFIFSKADYTNLISSKVNFKLNNMVADIQRENFIFIGASLDERDIDFYITQYENAGYFRQGSLFFVDPKPSVMMKGRIEELGGTIIEWTTEEFLKHVKSIGFKQDEQEKCKAKLNYSGIFLYDDIVKQYNTSEVYESRLYEGYNSTWRDLLEGWIFETPILKEIKQHIHNINVNGCSCYAVALHGKSLVGKDCLIKQIGIFLYREGYEVLEFKGKYLEINRLREYINVNINTKFALLIENASYYYKKIEMLLQSDFGEKQLLIITSSRNYYHYKKRYYLDGNSFCEFRVDDLINREYAMSIYSTLKEKGYIGDLSRDQEEGIREIIRHKHLINFFTELTYGSGFKKKLLKVAKNIFSGGEQIEKLYVELVIFEKADIPYYPSELLTSRYSIDFNIYRKERYDQLTEEQSMIVDYVRIEDNGISLKNKVLVKEIWRVLPEEKKIASILDILKCIAPYVSEHKNNYWRIVFESLLKEDCLERKLGIQVSEQLKIYYQVKKDFAEISYFWLQLGIAEQKNKNYEKALNHLKMAKNIRPMAYQIQHAIARNYLKHANCIEDFVTSETLFLEGERLMVALIDSNEYYKAKARNFSIHCYILEKSKYIRNQKSMISNKELLEMKKYIDLMVADDDTYVNSAIYEYVDLLKKIGKLDICRMVPGDRYYSALLKKEKMPYDDTDIIVDSY